MISSVTGFIAGVITGIYISSMYGEQLSLSLREAVELQQASTTFELPAPAVPATLSSPVTAGPDPYPELQLQSAPLPLPEPPPPATETGEATPELEQSWTDYASRAAELEPAGAFPWQQCFERAAASHGVPEALLLAIASGESNFDPAARSDKDAIGLMQIRWPTTSRHLGIRREADLYDPCTNVDAGARYLDELLQTYDNRLHLAVAAYNYGPGRISAAQVPEGARWYSHYIYQHLQQVLGLETTASSSLLPRPAGTGEQVLMSFNRAHRARDFVEFLRDAAPGLDLQLQTEALGQHEVVLLYASDEELERALQSLKEAGVGFLSSPPHSNFYL